MDTKTQDGSFSAEPTNTPQPMNNNPKQKTGGKGKTVFLIVLLVLLLGVAGYLGFMYKSTNDKLNEQKQELSEAQEEINKLQAAADEVQAAEDFEAKYNTAELSQSSCGGNPLLMSDVHVNDSYAVFRFLCANIDYETPIRIAAFKKTSDGNYEFTYGASTLTPNALPSYIYDSEPEFFATYGAEKF